LSRDRARETPPVKTFHNLNAIASSCRESSKAGRVCERVVVNSPDRGFEKSWRESSACSVGLRGQPGRQATESHDRPFPEGEIVDPLGGRTARVGHRIRPSAGLVRCSGKEPVAFRSPSLRVSRIRRGNLAMLRRACRPATRPRADGRRRRWSRRTTRMSPAVSLASKPALRRVSCTSRAPSPD
jgi:hypothetical protein